MSASAIEWTDETWNPVTGCDRVSPGCAHCYALDLAARLKAMGQPKYQHDGDPRTSGPGFGLTLHEDVLNEPLRWRKPRMVFVNSMSDLFHEQVPQEFIARVFATMARAPQHTFQVLTKRPERMLDVLNSGVFPILLAEAGVPGDPEYMAVLPNVWLGVSIENRRFVDRANLLREAPAAVRFISAEPLLGPLVPFCSECGGTGASAETNERCECMADPWLDGSELPPLNLDGIDWLIVGGESGLRHRTVRPEWVRSLRWAAEATGTAFFFKQWGGRTPKAGGRELDGRTWDELPTREGVAA